MIIFYYCHYSNYHRYHAALHLNYAMGQIVERCHCIRLEIKIELLLNFNLNDLDYLDQN